MTLRPWIAALLATSATIPAACADELGVYRYRYQTKRADIESDGRVTPDSELLGFARANAEEAAARVRRFGGVIVSRHTSPRTEITWTRSHLSDPFRQFFGGVGGEMRWVFQLLGSVDDLYANVERGLSSWVPQERHSLVHMTIAVGPARLLERGGAWKRVPGPFWVQAGGLFISGKKWRLFEQIPVTPLELAGLAQPGCDPRADALRAQLEAGWNQVQFTRGFVLIRNDDGIVGELLRHQGADLPAEQDGNPGWVDALAGLPGVARGSYQLARAALDDPEPGEACAAPVVLQQGRRRFHRLVPDQTLAEVADLYQVTLEELIAVRDLAAQGVSGEWVALPLRAQLPANAVLHRPEDRPEHERSDEWGDQSP